MSILCRLPAFFGLVVGVTLLAGSVRSQPAQPNATATSPDQRLVALADDKAINILDSATQKMLIRMQGHTAKVTTLAFAPDGKLLASGSLDKTVGLWDLPTGRQLRRFMAPSAIDRVSFSKDGKTLTTRETDKTLREWDIATGKELRQVKDK
ncbi:MAG TPA: hypothetical protein VEL76_24350 [Gemmataceae bacterium]|nr:hypothetical protein [Gemmataceae bacterium]